MSEDLLIENKVANSGLVTLNLEDYYEPAEKLVLDIKPWLFRELILKEKDYREFVKAHDWSQYAGKIVAFTCSSDAIIPVWAYMLLGVSVQPFAKRYFFASLPEVETILFQEALQKVDYSAFKDVRVIIKGCGQISIPVSAYVEITAKLQPFAKSIMYGEACSNVPVFKKAVASVKEGR
ncbi:MAG: hypothetical protein CFE21_15300 [Bacteroidetes bacterium B1(2017)]|nr:MAG: hypothetical protein CFE21_15300 [Bacteroidetes bacterium B1(2017)]